jgi:hypothetical protein
MNLVTTTIVHSSLVHPPPFFSPFSGNVHLLRRDLMDLLESMVMSLSRFAARMVILILAVVNVLAYPPEEILSSNFLLTS